MKNYIIYSTKMQGWLNANGVYTSEIKDAKQFTRNEALAKTNIQFNTRDKSFGYLPINTVDLMDIYA